MDGLRQSDLGEQLMRSHTTNGAHRAHRKHRSFFEGA
jgi:hypothetical protein